MDDNDLGTRIEAAISAAIQDAVAAHEGGFVLKWVALVESAGTDGDRGLWTMMSEDVMAWDVVGLLQHAMHLQQAQTLSELNGLD